MSRDKIVEGLLKKYKYNKARLEFLGNQLKHMTPETHKDYIEHKMYKAGYSGAVTEFTLDGGEEVARLNKVEETAQEYREKCLKEYIKARQETEKELKQISYSVAIVEDGLSVLGRVNEKYKFIIEKYYINNNRMEDIADSMHISRSRCYELCKEAVGWMARVIYGENAAM